MSPPTMAPERHQASYASWKRKVMFTPHTASGKQKHDRTSGNQGRPQDWGKACYRDEVSPARSSTLIS